MVLLRLTAVLAVSLAPSLAFAQTMTLGGADPGQLVKLLIIGAIVVFALRFVPLPHIVKAGAIWVLIFAAMIAAYSYRGPLESVGREMLASLVPGMAVPVQGEVVVRRSRGGQFVIGGGVNGAPVEFVFDTGASVVVLTASDAARAGLSPEALDYRLPVSTANGITTVAPIRLDSVRVGDITMERVRAAVARPDDLRVSLLGMTFLDRLSGYEVSRDRLVLTQ